MNTGMWEHPVTDKNLDIAKSFSKEIIVVSPIRKKLICGDTGIGAMAEVDQIVEVIRSYCKVTP
jgi:phosphopantothenoylcysteine decarboxylase